MELEILLAIITILTSASTAITGVGGGVILIAILPSFLPANIIIPIHGVTQLASNISRAFFGYKDIYFKAVVKYIIGSIFGVALSASFLVNISFSYIPLFIGSYILLSLWSKRFDEFIKKFENYYLIGFLQSGLSLIVGISGAMSFPILLKDCKDSNQVVVTVATLSSITHLLKVIVFIYIGFAFFEHLSLMISMVIAAIIGSFLGTLFRKRVDSQKLFYLIKIVVTVLAVKIIIETVFKF